MSRRNKTQGIIPTPGFPGTIALLPWMGPMTPPILGGGGGVLPSGGRTPGKSNKPGRPPVVLPVLPAPPLPPWNPPSQAPPARPPSLPPGPTPIAPPNNQPLPRPPRAAAKKKKQPGSVESISSSLARCGSQAVINGVLAALAERWPRFFPRVRGVSYLNQENSAQAPISSMCRFGVPAFQLSGGGAGAATDGNYYGCAYFSPFMKNKYAISNQYAAGNASFGTWTTSDDPILSPITSMISFYGFTGMCARVTNGGTFNNSGGTFICGIAPSTLFASGLTFATLQGYVGTSEEDMHQDFDVCYSFKGRSPNDYDATATSASVAGAGNSYMFIAWKATASQVIDAELVSRYDVTPTNSYSAVLSTDAEPVDVASYQRAQACLWPAAGTALPLVSMKSDKNALMVAAKDLLGRAASSILGPRLGEIAAYAIEASSEWLGEAHLETQLRNLLCTRPSPEAIVALSKKGVIPPKLADLYLEITAYRLVVDKAGVHVRAPDGTVTHYTRRTDNSPFGSSASTYVLTVDRPKERAPEPPPAPPRTEARARDAAYMAALRAVAEVGIEEAKQDGPWVVT